MCVLIPSADAILYYITASTKSYNTTRICFINAKPALNMLRE